MEGSRKFSVWGSRIFKKGGGNDSEKAESNSVALNAESNGLSENNI